MTRETTDNQKIIGTLNVTGAVDLDTTLNVDGASTFVGSVTINDAGADVDVRMEGDTDANLYFLDASTDRVGIGTNTPSSKLDVNGTITAGQIIKAASGSGIALQDDGGNTALTVKDGGYLQNGTIKVVTSQFNKTNNTFADVTGLSIALPAAGTFHFSTRIWATAPIVSGVGAKWAMAYSGTTSLFRAGGWIYSSVVGNVQGGFTSATGQVLVDGGSGVSASNYYVEMKGVLTVTGAGNLTVQFAQVTTNASASSILTGSTLEVWQVA